jgi:hypothetical protein
MALIFTPGDTNPCKKTGLGPDSLSLNSDINRQDRYTHSIQFCFCFQSPLCDTQ